MGLMLVMDASHLVYLEVALKTLRLHPPVPVAPKYVVEDNILADRALVKGKSMIVLTT